MNNANEESQDKEMTVFYLDEYYEVDWMGLDMIAYCFIRKNLKGVVNAENIREFINSMLIDSMIEWQGNYNRIRRTKAFADYEERFLNGEIIILPRKEVKSEV